MLLHHKKTLSQNRANFSNYKSNNKNSIYDAKIP